MSTSIGFNELHSFHQFVTNQLQVGITPEQCLQLWRAQNPTADELDVSTAAVEQALNDMQAGDTGQSARSLIEAARQQHGLLGEA